LIANHLYYVYYYLRRQVAIIFQYKANVQKHATPRVPVSSIYNWSKNAGEKNEAKMAETDVQCQSLPIVFVCAVNTKQQAGFEQPAQMYRAQWRVHALNHKVYTGALTALTKSYDWLKPKLKLHASGKCAFKKTK
jgi:hypothetical protein